ncbi:hypothetical protein MAMC_01752 [Methylacidimicrobium cyclopophantes]|uniref:DUF5666 domain-containing protein n=1 Tax=Methylacidimicrobium cyclopophantes TaxID=1041766 RepID=A0A5E6MEW0_9BACT|nr:hypothetical protein [Methylacidimicrobium cyclopophantes]VVM07656.1 hypothetical protein MAMC_01752 [Methylacidimicrobium cyclopophantes]
MRGAIGVLLSLVIFGFGASSTFAHGNEIHVIGQIASMEGKVLTVKTREGKSIAVELTDQSEISKGKEKEPATVADLMPGERVVIHARKAGEKLQARTVQIGKAKAAEAGKAKTGS